MSALTNRNSGKGWRDTKEGKETLEMTWATSGQPVIPQDSDLRGDTETKDDPFDHDHEGMKRQLQARFAREAEEERLKAQTGNNSTVGTVSTQGDDSNDSKVFQAAKTTARSSKWKPMSIAPSESAKTADEETKAEEGWTVVSKKDKKTATDFGGDQFDFPSRSGEARGQGWQEGPWYYLMEGGIYLRYRVCRIEGDDVDFA